MPFQVHSFSNVKNTLGSIGGLRDKKAELNTEFHRSLLLKLQNALGLREKEKVANSFMLVISAVQESMNRGGNVQVEIVGDRDLHNMEYIQELTSAENLCKLETICCHRNTFSLRSLVHNDRKYNTFGVSYTGTAEKLRQLASEAKVLITYPHMWAGDMTFVERQQVLTNGARPRDAAPQQNRQAHREVPNREVAIEVHRVAAITQLFTQQINIEYLKPVAQEQAYGKFLKFFEKQQGLSADGRNCKVIERANAQISWGQSIRKYIAQAWHEIDKNPNFDSEEKKDVQRMLLIQAVIVDSAQAYDEGDGDISCFKGIAERAHRVMYAMKVSGSADADKLIPYQTLSNFVLQLSAKDPEINPVLGAFQEGFHSYRTSSDGVPKDVIKDGKITDKGVEFIARCLGVGVGLREGFKPDSNELHVVKGLVTGLILKNSDVKNNIMGYLEYQG